MNSCNPVNIVWIERGIILALIDYLTNNYKYLNKKFIIVENRIYRHFLRMLFPFLHFKHYQENDNNPNNFYFNIRRILKNQDIIIDYLKNYDTIIHTSKVELIPWYDANDILVIYHYNVNKQFIPESYKQTLTVFSDCQRSNFYGHLWDLFHEKQILLNYVQKINPQINWNYLFMLINTFFKKNIKHNMVNRYFYIKEETTIEKTDSTVENKTQETNEIKEIKPIKPNPKPSETIEINHLSSENQINQILKVLSQKISLINEVLVDK